MSPQRERSYHKNKMNQKTKQTNLSFQKSERLFITHAKEAKSIGND